MKRAGVWGLLLAMMIAGMAQYSPSLLSRITGDAGPPAPAADEQQGDGAHPTYQRRHHRQQIADSGRVVAILDDDLDGSRHQRFILRLASGQTLLVAHNIDLAPRVSGLEAGDTVAFYGEYVWNDKGGVLHWTHRDPRGAHPGGWLKHRDRRYQ
ncbi:DUF3465 domain-containing protein [Halomonas garicola]|uniref:DUF3465 domain-containing protein n=1 Tax=Halomonas garicola TaxID=1690008 RepID=UPI00289B5921|nr:DUF3465 domain-containing protein [Halomonas garicola]